jgi:hypothetical protein
VTVAPWSAARSGAAECAITVTLFQKLLLVIITHITGKINAFSPFCDLNSAVKQAFLRIFSRFFQIFPCATAFGQNEHKKGHPKVSLRCVDKKDALFIF